MRSTLRCVAECRHRIDAYESAADDNDHKLTLSLRIRIFDETDYGRYTCFASNRFGQTEASMLLSGQNQWPNFVKPRPRQQQCRSNVRFCCQNGNDIERVHRKILPFRQSRMLLRYCCRCGRGFSDLTGIAIDLFCSFGTIVITICTWR